MVSVLLSLPCMVRGSAARHRLHINEPQTPWNNCRIRFCRIGICDLWVLNIYLVTIQPLRIQNTNSCFDRRVISPQTQITLIIPQIRPSAEPLPMVAATLMNKKYLNTQKRHTLKILLQIIKLRWNTLFLSVSPRPLGAARPKAESVV